ASLKHAGLELVNATETTNNAELGVRTSIQNGRIIVNSITRESGAWSGGINVKDELISINDVRLNTGDDVEKFLRTSKPGEVCKVLVSRDGLLQALNVTLTKDETKHYIILPLPVRTTMQDILRKAWLGL